MRVLRSLAWGCGTVLLIAGCNAIAGLDADYEVGSASSPDGSVSSSDGSSGGSTFDVGPRDSGPGGSIGCLSGALFCDDFEDTSKTTNPFGWARSENTGGSPVVEAAAGFGSSRGLRADVSGNGFSGKVALWKVVDRNFTINRRMNLTFAFRVMQAGIDYTVVGAIQLNGSEYGLAVYRNPRCPNAPEPCLDENQPSGQHTFTAAVPLVANTWHRAEISVLRTASAYEGRVLVDGATLHEGLTSLSPGDPFGPGVEVGVGAFFTGPNGTTQTAIDDVVVRYE